ncbi:MAG: hypothetical protein IKC87_04110 [Clostridia bacterium]|nr:hypothetical protein [Clostridia bacterium]
MLTVRIAGLSIAIDNKYRHIEHLCKDYLTDDEPDFTVFAEEGDIDREREACLEEFDERFSDGYLESTVIYRKIADKLPEYGAFVFHGAVLSVDGLAYAFTARSGVGKTTHTRLWLELFGERAHYINGDKPIIRFIDGTPYAFGTPWMGKESYGRNTSARLAGIAHVKRGQDNIARTASANEMSTVLLTQMYLPKDRLMAMRTLSLLSEMIGKVKLIELECNMEKTAPIPPAREFGISLDLGG